jgi:sarcosine oxidase subunit gamma
MPAPLDFGDPEAEATRAKTLALCDVSALPRLTFKGPGARAFLDTQGVPAPEAIYEWLPLEGDGLVCRTGATEFFVEEGIGGGLLSRIEQALDAGRAGVYRVLRQDAALLLCGRRAAEVLAQTCGYDLRQGASRLVMTRVAGVSCAMLQREFDGIPTYQLWLDGSYGLYLWEALLAITGELGGGPVGMACLFPILVMEG